MCNYAIFYGLEPKLCNSLQSLALKTSSKSVSQKTFSLYLKNFYDKYEDQQNAHFFNKGYFFENFVPLQLFAKR